MNEKQFYELNENIKKLNIILTEISEKLN